MLRFRARLLPAALLVSCITVPARAQIGDPAAAPRSGCYRFDFGVWAPSLEQAKRDLERVGADWRVPAPREAGTMWDVEGDAPALLFPVWWPNGIAVRFDSAARGDTLRGEAWAYVPDGRVQAPHASVRAVAGPCRGARP